MMVIFSCIGFTLVFSLVNYETSATIEKYFLTNCKRKLRNNTLNKEWPRQQYQHEQIEWNYCHTVLNHLRSPQHMITRNLSNQSFCIVAIKCNTQLLKYLKFMILLSHTITWIKFNEIFFLNSFWLIILLS